VEETKQCVCSKNFTNVSFQLNNQTNATGAPGSLCANQEVLSSKEQTAQLDMISVIINLFCHIITRERNSEVWKSSGSMMSSKRPASFMC
jgi:hypothetical protein